MHDAFTGGVNVWMAYDWVYPPRNGGEALIHVDWGNDYTLKKPYWVFRQWAAPLDARNARRRKCLIKRPVKVTCLFVCKADARCPYHQQHRHRNARATLHRRSNRRPANPPAR